MYSKNSKIYKKIIFKRLNLFIERYKNKEGYAE